VRLYRLEMDGDKMAESVTYHHKPKRLLTMT
jgi:hypothetical protein